MRKDLTSFRTLLHMLQTYELNETPSRPLTRLTQEKEENTSPGCICEERFRPHKSSRSTADRWVSVG